MSMCPTADEVRPVSVHPVSVSACYATNKVRPISVCPVTPVSWKPDPADPTCDN